MYEVRIYHNTGFNAVNIADSPALLNDPTQFVFEDVPSLEILQNIHLSSIRIKADWQKIKDVDYCRIGNSTDGYFYYFVESAYMHSRDVAELELISDYCTSAGGLQNVEILDGVVTRCHVLDDTYGAWNIEDEFLTPAEPLLLDTEQINFGKSGNTYVESSLDLIAMGTIGAAASYVTEDDIDEKVVVPKSIANVIETQFVMDGKVGTSEHTTLMPLSTITKRGIDQLRALGIESAVRSTTVLPSALVDVATREEKITFSNDSATIETQSAVGTQQQVFENASNLTEHDNVTAVVCSQVTAQFVDTTTNLSYEYQQVNNKRVLYGRLNRVGILTTAGNRLESNPEETRSGNAKIQIRSIGDPHPNGAPYHRFKSMNGNSSKDGFFMNAVKGLQWKQIPLMYQNPSGSALNTISFNNSREDAQRQGGLAVQTYRKNRANGKSEYGSRFLGNLAQNAMSGVGGGLQGIYGGIAGVTYGAISSIISSGTNKDIENYKYEKQREMEQFAIQQNVSSPEISVSYDGEAFRDFYGETVIVYRYRPTPTDVRRLDNILTMYGYKVNIAGKDAPLTGRQYFNYIMGNITVGGNIPKWLADGVTMQVANGVRIWHVKPSTNYYQSNPIV